MIMDTNTNILCGNDEHDFIYEITDLAIGFLVAALNVFEIIIIARIKKRKKYEVLLLSLSFSDCLFGVSNVLLASLYISNECHARGLLECFYILYLFFFFSSMFHLTIMSIDRVIAVVKPFKHKFLFTRRRIYIIIAIIWSFTLIICGSLFIADELTELSVQKVESEKEMIVSITIIIVDVVMIFSYSIIIYYYSLKNSVATQPTKRQKKLPIICIILGATFVLFTLPFALLVFTMEDVPFYANVILVGNSGVNSIVYFFRDKIEERVHKNATKKILK